MNFVTGESDNEDVLYQQLLCVCSALPDETSYHSTTENEDHWMAFNDVVDSIVALGHTDYVKFKIQPKTASYGGKEHQLVNIVTLKTKVLAVLGKLGAEFGCGNPASDLSLFKQPNGFSVSQQANPINVASSSQHQEQSQENVIKLDHHFDQVEGQLIKILSATQKTELMPLFEEWKKEPTMWSRAEKVATKLMGFGRDSFLTILPLLTQAFIRSKGLM